MKCKTKYDEGLGCGLIPADGRQYCWSCLLAIRAFCKLHGLGDEKMTKSVFYQLYDDPKEAAVLAAEADLMMSREGMSIKSPSHYKKPMLALIGKTNHETS